MCLCVCVYMYVYMYVKCTTCVCVCVCIHNIYVCMYHLQLYEHTTRIPGVHVLYYTTHTINHTCTWITYIIHERQDELVVLIEV